VVPPYILPHLKTVWLIHLRFNALDWFLRPEPNSRNNFMPTKKPHIKAYVSPEEYELVAGQAARASLSISAFVKAVCLGYEVKSTIDQDAVLALAKINADLGRLGGLFKQALAERAIDQKLGHDFLGEINLTRRRLEEKVKNL
jgi:hypothetical protein